MGSIVEQYFKNMTALRQRSAAIESTRSKRVSETVAAYQQAIRKNSRFLEDMLNNVKANRDARDKVLAEQRAKFADKAYLIFSADAVKGLQQLEQSRAYADTGGNRAVSVFRGVIEGLRQAGLERAKQLDALAKSNAERFKQDLEIFKQQRQIVNSDSQMLKEANKRLIENINREASQQQQAEKQVFTATNHAIDATQRQINADRTFAETQRQHQISNYYRNLSAQRAQQQLDLSQRRFALQQQKFYDEQQRRKNEAMLGFLANQPTDGQQKNDTIDAQISKLQKAGDGATTESGLTLDDLLAAKKQLGGDAQFTPQLEKQIVVGKISSENPDVLKYIAGDKNIQLDQQSSEFFDKYRSKVEELMKSNPNIDPVQAATKVLMEGPDAKFDPNSFPTVDKQKQDNAQQDNTQQNNAQQDQQQSSFAQFVTSSLDSNDPSVKDAAKIANDHLFTDATLAQDPAGYITKKQKDFGLIDANGNPIDITNDQALQQLDPDKKKKAEELRRIKTLYDRFTTGGTQ